MSTNALTQTPADDTLAIASEDDLLVTVRRDDLTAALGFLIDTVRGFGPEDVADYLEATPDDTTAIVDRLDRVRLALSS